MEKGIVENSGPYLTAALLCERVLQEKDETVSVIRLIDRLAVTVNALNSPETMPSITANLTLFVGLKSGSARGRNTIKIRTEAPSGITLSDQLLSALFEGEDRGVNLIVNMGLTLDQEGVYWFNILLEETLLTRIPLRVLYQRIGQSA